MTKLIKTEEENTTALVFVERLMKDDPEKDSKEGILLAMLVEAIGFFEKRYSRPPLNPTKQDQEMRKAGFPYCHKKAGRMTHCRTCVKNYKLAKTK